MINIEDLIQLKAFARQDGALLSLVWIASFAFLIYAPGLPWCNLLALSTPFFVGWRLVKFRNYALGGVISLRRGYAYSVYTFLYASTIFAIAQYLYFKFLDGGTFLSMLTETMNALAPIYEDSGITRQALNDGISSMAEITPIQWAFMFLVQNAIIAVTASLPIAAICMRRVGKARKTNQRNNNQ